MPGVVRIRRIERSHCLIVGAIQLVSFLHPQANVFIILTNLIITFRLIVHSDPSALRDKLPVLAAIVE